MTRLGELSFFFCYRREVKNTERKRECSSTRNCWRFFRLTEQNACVDCFLSRFIYNKNTSRNVKGFFFSLCWANSAQVPSLKECFLKNDLQEEMKYSFGIRGCRPFYALCSNFRRTETTVRKKTLKKKSVWHLKLSPTRGLQKPISCD